MTAVRDLSFDTLGLERNDRVLTVRYSCPPLNFLTKTFIRELDQLTSHLDRDATIGARIDPLRLALLVSRAPSLRARSGSAFAFAPASVGTTSGKVSTVET